jgi:hypothetical protein
VRTILIIALLTGSSAFAADTISPIAQVFDGQVSTVEREVLGLAQAMPADKYNFAPTNGTFTGVRTFALEVRHTATMTYMIAASILQEKVPVEIGKDFDGSDSIRTKAQLIEYFKNSLAYAHKAVRTLTPQNEMDPVPSPFGRGTMPRVAAASFITYHAFDHYGQMVVYGRMNGVIPPASQPRGPSKSGGAKGRTAAQ